MDQQTKTGYFVWSVGENAFVVWNTHDPYLAFRGIAHFLYLNELEPISGLQDAVYETAEFLWLDQNDMHKKDWSDVVKLDQNEMGTLTPFTLVSF